MSLQRLETKSHDFVPDPISDQEGEAMLRAVVKLFSKWRLTDDDAATLLDLPVRSYRRWKTGQVGRISRDTKARLSNILGIHKALRILFTEADRVYGWVSQPNTAFGGSTALCVMLRGDLTDLMRVRRYLDAERGAW